MFIQNYLTIFIEAGFIKVPKRSLWLLNFIQRSMQQFIGIRKTTAYHPFLYFKGSFNNAEYKNLCFLGVDPEITSNGA